MHLLNRMVIARQEHVLENKLIKPMKDLFTLLVGTISTMLIEIDVCGVISVRIGLV